MASAPLVSCYNISMSFGSAELFTSLSFSVHEGDRIGIIGANGSGKTTLFRILSKQIEPNSGTVSMRTGVKIAIVTQAFNALQHGEVSVASFLELELPLELNLDKRRKTIEEEITALAHEAELKPEVVDSPEWNEQLSHLQESLLNLEGAGTQNIIESALRAGHLLHLAERSVKNLSGGEQKRLQIVSTLLKNPQLIFLDEPTNHLDVETVEWLESFLLNVALEGSSFVGIKSDKQDQCAFVLISHDRALLDTLVNQIVELDRGVWSSYSGNFEYYIGEKIKRDTEQKSSRDKMANLFRRELAWLRSGTKARTTKQTARIERAHELKSQLGHTNARVNKSEMDPLEFSAILAGEERDAFDTIVPVVRNLGEQELVKLRNASILHPLDQGNKRFICSDLSVVLKPKMRIALLGANGCGKSTILRAIAERLPLFAGDVVLHDLAQVIYFDQHRNSLNMDLTIMETLSPKGDYVLFSNKNIHIMSYLDQFLFSKYDANKVVKNLSGGEQARLLLAKLMLDSGNVLLLDEPTNDLDIPTLQMLEQSVMNYQGGVLFTSHDRYFIQRVATHILAFEGEVTQNSVTRGRWQMYADLEQAMNAMEQEELRQEQAALSKAKESSKQAKETQTAKPKLSFSEKKELAQLETQINELEKNIATLSVELAKLYEQGTKYDVAAVKEKEIQEKKAKLDAVMARWEVLFEKV